MAGCKECVLVGSAHGALKVVTWIGELKGGRQFRGAWWGGGGGWGEVEEEGGSVEASVDG